MTEPFSSVMFWGVAGLLFHFGTNICGWTYLTFLCPRGMRPLERKRRDGEKEPLRQKGRDVCLEEGCKGGVGVRICVWVSSSGPPFPIVPKHPLCFSLYFILLVYLYPDGRKRPLFLLRVCFWCVREEEGTENSWSIETAPSPMFYVVRHGMPLASAYPERLLGCDLRNTRLEMRPSGPR